MVARGFTMLKFDVDVPTPYETDEYNRDLSSAEIDFAAALVKAVRDAVGPQIGLAIDCHWNYGVRAAVELARALEPMRLLWLEDPIPPDNMRALGEVQRNTRTTIATGENNYLRGEFQSLIVDSGLRLLAPDVQKIGLWEGRKIADLADSHYVNLSLHNISGPIGTMAGVHLCAAIPNFLALEWHAASIPFFDQLIKGDKQPLIRGGKVAVPDAPDSVSNSTKRSLTSTGAGTRSSSGSDRYVFLIRLHAVSAPVGSSAAVPSSICWILPSVSMTKVVRLANPLSGSRTP